MMLHVGFIDSACVSALYNASFVTLAMSLSHEALLTEYMACMVTGGPRGSASSVGEALQDQITRRITAVQTFGLTKSVQHKSPE
jgi:hypothetical protein